MVLASKKQFFTARSRAILFVLEEAFLLFLMVLLVYFILGIRVTKGVFFFFQNPMVGQNILLLLITIVVFVVIYIGIAVKDSAVQKVHKEFWGLFASTLKQKIFGLSGQVLALILAELVFTVGLALSVFLYLDPDINVFPFPSNYVAFFLLLVFGYVIFSTTKDFRERTYGRGFLFAAIAGDLGPHKLVRVTNKKTGSLRIRAKVRR